MMFQRLIGLVAVMGLFLPAHGGHSLAADGTARYKVVHASDATAPEVHAARELAQHLEQVTGASFPILAWTNGPLPERVVFVGQGAAARELCPDVPWKDLGPEEVVLRSAGDRILLSGGRPRGTLYAVSRFLQDYCGVRWWTPWASRIPRTPDLQVPELNVRTAPAFESRDPFWHTAFDEDWAVRNFSNSESARIRPERGGAVRYKGFVHTFYPLVPPARHFEQHPEWYSLIKGKRTHERAQLCTTNPQLREFMVQRVREWLREDPEASIISISQNDWYNPCECDACKAIDDAEGSHAGTMLALVNYIAEKLEPEFPHVAFDTLAYQYTRKPPKTLRPRDNVIIRLCSIECNFREPLDHPSNASFADDIRGWSQICRRLYIWDYTTDFAHYVQPHPNWFVLGPNLRFFHRHNVRGVFEQGAYQSHGSEMAEMRAWVLAQLLWNPYQDDRALIREFVEGYYGPAAAPHILAYFDLMHEASAGFHLSCFSPTDTPFHRFATLAAAERLWAKAEEATTDPELRLRIQMARLPLRYVWLSRWDSLREEARTSGAEWPLPDSRKETAEAFAALARGREGAPWTKVTHLNESRRTVDAFVAPWIQSGD